MAKGKKGRKGAGDDRWALIHTICHVDIYPKKTLQIQCNYSNFSNSEAEVEAAERIEKKKSKSKWVEEKHFAKVRLCQLLPETPENITQSRVKLLNRETTKLSIFGKLRRT